ncbi:MAG: hypothetical protein ABSD42_10480 [Candidatus Bathyarchaeia archaeon]
MSEILSQILNFLNTSVPAYFLLPPLFGLGAVAAIVALVPRKKSANVVVPKVGTEASEEQLANIMISRCEANPNDKKAEQWLIAHNYTRS